MLIFGMMHMTLNPAWVNSEYPFLVTNASVTECQFTQRRLYELKTTTLNFSLSPCYDKTKTLSELYVLHNVDLNYI